ncbi:hypothetical protein GGS23DRAFT_558316 [Durotheca rogersii]|uniref:uncharacterized protein n=1 Tax=Durotheca rogersii TaxID=419775 RepID=UPI00221EC1A8|nr:uncharacterized protein GGS23DRAFT_558316 [Durotheca rogersii]KAI5865236.1 hypothetical protein GGS23DRAFT_558316 [Durotheca rogersii]
MATTRILTYPPPLDDKAVGKSSRNILIFFISGNPGLIGYYEPFLSTLRARIDETASLRHIRFHIYGQDLAGFRDDDHEPFTARRKPYDLEYQIRHNLATIERLRVESGSRTGLPYDEVLLIGHSVGAYIALELFRRQLRSRDSAPYLNLASGLLLFPTIEHIAKSPNGWKLDLLRRIPLLSDNVHYILRAFLHLCPRRAVYWVVRRILGFPPSSAEVTTRWLKSRDGVWQTLHMGLDEMRTIGEDRWDEELWEIAHNADALDRSPPKFFFFFGKHDQWVASHYRDQFIRRRQNQVERTRLIVDEGDIPHAFCIHHNETVAEKAIAWIAEMYSAT